LLLLLLLLLLLGVAAERTGRIRLEGFSGGSINLVGRQLNISGFPVNFFISSNFLEHI
jgi:hypothetical protein